MIPSHMQGAVNEEVNARQSKALDQLKAKYDAGHGGMDTSVDGPTGAAYKEAQAKRQQQRKLAKERQSEEGQATTVCDLDLEDEDEDEDAELRDLREQRLKQIKAAHMAKVENVGKGHGSYREITQDEFLKEMTSSERVVCHFYHKDFPRCAIMDHHIQKLVGRHIESKFVKIDAEKAPFFVEKVSQFIITSV